MSESYKKSGVDLDSGYESVRRIKKHIEGTKRNGVFGALGSFGGMFDLSALNIKEPVLVSGTDGVGTKLMLAIDAKRYDTIGIDLVAMCVNDVLAQGAEPLYFLDYIAIGKNEPSKIERIVSGIAKGCSDAGCALIGGETAEMPDMYSVEKFDLAGFAVGVVEKSKIITGEKVSEGDVLIGLPSSGIHSNGYSLVRKVVQKDNQLNLKEHIEELNDTLENVLLEPTKIYIKPVLSLIDKFDVHGVAHITGGGFDENIPRILSDDLGVVINENSWPNLPVFNYLEKMGNIPHREMYNIFNMGIGMVIALNKDQADEAIKHLNSIGQDSHIIGEIIKGQGVTIK